MGLFDMLAKQALGGMLGGNQGGSDMLSGLLQQVGGLDGLKTKFHSVGLGNTFESWVGTGENLHITAEQLSSAVGPDAIRDLASKVGLDASMLMPLLNQFLPQIIDKLTPQGHIEATMPSGEKLQEVLSSVMKGGLGGLFGK